VTAPTGCRCRDFLVQKYAEMGIEVAVSERPPVVQTAYEDLKMRCPHGIRWYAEPTSDQQAAWARDGVA
jgi:hypothetical protein